jgi:hypothetical protein
MCCLIVAFGTGRYVLHALLSGDLISLCDARAWTAAQASV